MSKNNSTAVLYCTAEPNSKIKEKLLGFIREKYGRDYKLTCVIDLSITDGFRLVVGDDTYNWNKEFRLKQLRERLADAALSCESDVIPLLRDSISKWVPNAYAEQSGRVISVGDGIATVSSIKGVFLGEILIFENSVRGMVQILTEEKIGCILFDSETPVSAGSKVIRTGKTAGMPCSEQFLGRVVNALGMPIDGKGEIESADYRPIETPAPGIISRKSVDTPLETGILTIDSMFPIGRGQRELIIGDRQTGKTSIAIDTILNQKGRDVICIYVAIGQKASSVASIVKTLENSGALDYTCVITATAGDSSSLQYIAPYAGCALAEFFMYQGRDALIVYDDLSKHAVAYRAISLLLGRSPGREAFPGDVFYLHSRLLERSAQLSEEAGGGSMTALPIVETQSGDVSAYIPTNIISITDGQIFLETDLFYSGQRPAVNVGLSVSRVGGDAQTKAMKKASFSLKFRLALYRDMEVFTQFSSDLDEDTKKQLKSGQKLMAMLRQKQSNPLSAHAQVISLVCALNGGLENIEVSQVHDFLDRLIAVCENEYSSMCDRIESTGILEDADKEKIIEISNKVTI